MNTLKLETRGDNQVVVTRRFKASPEFLYRAHTEADLIRKWMLGPPGYTMPVCISENRPGGKIRFEWAHAEHGGFYLTGEYVALDPYTKIKHVERMHLPDPTPDNHVTTTFEKDGDHTVLKVVMSLPSSEAREAMLASGMDEGMEASYRNLDELAAA
ncbi:SRPBCC domain-containing protein [Pseudoxanthomonas sp. 10H]|uniref:SRPBCC domain-containing protein n=1 Tax=Pseudoxanthomonas sp. 10H TaxID=3242729 RepID=UPI0035562BBE